LNDRAFAADRQNHQWEILSRDGRRGTVEIMVRVSPTGMVLETSIRGGSAPADAISALRRALIGGQSPRDHFVAWGNAGSKAISRGSCWMITFAPVSFANFSNLSIDWRVCSRLVLNGGTPRFSRASR